MTGKEKCRLLREIRREIAQANKIIFLTRECDYPGDDCLGTCPVCDAEIRWMDAELNRKAAAGEKITLAGISLDTYLRQVRKDDRIPFFEEDEIHTGIICSVDQGPKNSFWDDIELDLIVQEDPLEQVPEKERSQPDRNVWQPVPRNPAEPPAPDEIQGGIEPMDDDMIKWFSDDGDTIV